MMMSEKDFFLSAKVTCSASLFPTVSRFQGVYTMDVKFPLLVVGCADRHVPLGQGWKEYAKFQKLPVKIAQIYWFRTGFDHFMDFMTILVLQTCPHLSYCKPDCHNWGWFTICKRFSRIHNLTSKVRQRSRCRHERFVTWLELRWTFWTMRTLTVFNWLDTFLWKIFDDLDCP